MPGFDGTGPMGKGPMTGGCRGYCVMLDSRAPMAEPDRTDELSFLKQWAGTIQNRIHWLNDRLQAINRQSGETEEKQ